MKRLLTALALSIVFIFPSSAMTVKGVDVSETLTVDEQQLILNGAGMRTKFFVNAYVAALYLPEKSTDAQAIVEGDSVMAVRLYINSGMINAKRMSDSTRDGFVRSTGGNIAPIEAEMEEMISAFKDEVKEGDVFDLIYVPNDGVRVYRNGERKALVKGMPFKQAMFGIWLSDNNIQKDLRQAMLNR